MGWFLKCKCFQFSPDGEQSEETDCWSDSYGCNLHANGDVVAGLKVAK